MKLLLDQNLSYRLTPSLQEAFPGSVQVAQLKMDESTDRQIWDYAQLHGYAIVTLDADFHELSMLEGGPPMVIWLKCGNQPKSVILNKLLAGRAVILDANEDPNIWCVEIY